MKILKFETAEKLKSVCSNIRSSKNKKWLFDESDIVSVNGIKSPLGFEVDKHSITYYSSQKQGTESIYPPYVIEI